MQTLIKKTKNVLRLCLLKCRYPTNIYFQWYKCWNININKGFEIRQFPLPGQLRVRLEGNITIEKDVWFKGSATLEIGANTLVGRRTVIGCNEKIRIGTDCLFGENVRIQDTDHRFDTTKKLIRKQGISTAPIRIGNDVWIGYGAVVTKGVTIGDGCVIGANSVVTHDIPPYSVAVGAPARVIKKRDQTR